MVSIWNNLKNSIKAVILPNNKQQITGEVLQTALLNIISSLGENATYAGFANPSTNPGTADGPVFYIAESPGVYLNFSGVTVEPDCLAVITNMGTHNWRVDKILDTRAQFEGLKINSITSSNVANGIQYTVATGYGTFNFTVPKASYAGNITDGIISSSHLQKLEETANFVNNQKNNYNKPNGVVLLNAEGKLPSRFIPNAFDDIITYAGKISGLEGTVQNNTTYSSEDKGLGVYYNEALNCFMLGKQMPDGEYTYFKDWADSSRFGRLVDGYVQPYDGKLYYIPDNYRYERWNGEKLVYSGTDLALGYTEDTAYPGSDGKKNKADVDALNAVINFANEMFVDVRNDITVYNTLQERLNELQSANALPNNMHLKVLIVNLTSGVKFYECHVDALKYNASVYTEWNLADTIQNINSTITNIDYESRRNKHIAAGSIGITAFTYNDKTEWYIPNFKNGHFYIRDFNVNNEYKCQAFYKDEKCTAFKNCLAFNLLDKKFYRLDSSQNADGSYNNKIEEAEEFKLLGKLKYLDYISLVADGTKAEIVDVSTISTINGTLHNAYMNLLSNRDLQYKGTVRLVFKKLHNLAIEFQIDRLEYTENYVALDGETYHALYAGKCTYTDVNGIYTCHIAFVTKTLNVISNNFSIEISKLRVASIDNEDTNDSVGLVTKGTSFKEELKEQTDKSLNATSNNAVANKVVATQLSNKANRADLNKLANQFTEAGTAINATTGAIVSNSSYKTTPLLLLNQGMTLFVNGYGSTDIAAIAFYDRNGTFISSIAFEADKYEYTAFPYNWPSNAVYFRACSANSYNNGNASWGNATEQERREALLTEKVNKVRARVQQFCMCNTGIDYATGNEINSSSYVATPFLLIDKSHILQTYNVSGPSGVAAIALYDKDKNYLKSNSLEFSTGTNSYGMHCSNIPADARYFRACTHVDSAEKATWSNSSSSSIALEEREGFFAEELDASLAASKTALFIDMYNTAFGSHGRYDPANAPDPQHTFYGNKLWLTYDEALAVVAAGRPHLAPAFGPRTRTNLPFLTAASDVMRGFFADGHANDVVEVVNISNLFNINDAIQIQNGSNFIFYSNKKLREVIGTLDMSAVTNSVGRYAFSGCPVMEEIRISRLKISIELFASSPRLSLATFQFIVAHAANTTPIAITVHPTVYAKLTGDTTNAAAAALTADELAQWQQVLTDASAKNIQFVANNVA